jgi:hypothetical protein
MIKERDVERYFKAQLEKRGALVFKFVSPGQAGVPDRVVLLPGGRVVFAEMKAPGEKPRPLQRAVFARMARAGHPVYIIDSREAVKKFMEEVTPDAIQSASVSGGSDSTP